MKKEISKIVMFIGLVTYLLGLLFDGMTAESIITVSTSQSGLLFAFISCLCFAKTTAVANVGFCLSGISGINELIIMVNMSKNDDLSISSIALLIMLVASIIYLLKICLEFFGFVKIANRAQGAKESCVNELNKLKDYEKEGVISQEEFLTLKSKILATSNETSTFDDLKKWKKLLDQQVITEEEFKAIKAKIF